MSQCRYSSLLELFGLLSFTFLKQAIDDVQSNSDNLKQTEDSIQNISAEIAALEQTYRTLESELSNLRSLPTLSKLRADLEARREERKLLESRLLHMKEGHFKPVDLVKRDELFKLHSKMQSVLGKRRKIFRGFWEVICDHLPDNKEACDLWVSCILFRVLPFGRFTGLPMCFEGKETRQLVRPEEAESMCRCLVVAQPIFSLEDSVCVEISYIL
jgi:hypothetical protein